MRDRSAKCKRARYGLFFCWLIIHLSWNEHLEPSPLLTIFLQD